MKKAVLLLSGPAIVVGAAGIVVAVQRDLGIGRVYFGGLALVLLGVALQFAANRAQRPRGPAPSAVITQVPVDGRWMALNSPGTRVPSHGTHRLAQTYAIDILFAPEGAQRRRLDLLWPVMRRPTAYPSFGRAVRAPFDGVVVSTYDARRDHLSRTSVLGLVYLVLEGFVRSLGHPRSLLGNHVVVQRSGTEVFALLAHVRRGSVRVAAGDQVIAGQVVAECGNSGNSSEPHLHFQLMDAPDADTAYGVPFAWPVPGPDGTAGHGTPANGDHVVGAADATAGEDSRS